MSSREACPRYNRSASGRKPSGKSSDQEKTIIREINEKTLDVNSEEFVFMYKNRSTKGSALHVAAVRGNEWLVGQLIRLGAMVDARCTAQVFGQVATLEAIHLAAGGGHEKIIKKLVLAQADPNTKTTIRDDEEHYAPLHEAAVRSHASAVRCLLELSADPNIRNISNATPLHMAASSGSWESAEALVEANADLSVVDKQRLSPLMIAVRGGGNFPECKLHLLARPCMTDLRSTAQEDSSAALALLKNRATWHVGLTQPAQGETMPTVHDMAGLIGDAPLVAAELIDVLTEVPIVKEHFHHPLARYAVPQLYEKMRCEYEPDTEWTWADTGGDSSKEAYPAWHDRIAGVSKHKKSVVDLTSDTLTTPKDMVRAQIKLLRLPDVVSVDLMFALSKLKENDEKHIFVKPAVQAIMDYTWMQCARHAYIAHFIIRICELAVLMGISDQSVASHESYRRTAWSFCATTSMRETIMEITQFSGYALGLKSPTAYFNIKNWVDIFSISMFAALTWEAMGTYSWDFKHLLSIVSFLRWVQLLYMLRSFRWGNIGLDILPILESFFRVGGIFIVVIILFVAFVNAIKPMSDGGSGDWLDAALGAFRLLFLGDGDGIDFVLGMSGASNDRFSEFFLYFATIIFCIYVLNLFIAVHGEEYARALATVEENFYLERSSICLDCLVQPRLSRELPLGGLYYVCYLLVVIPAVIIWFLVLTVEEVPPLVASFILLMGLMFGDCILRKRPWTEVESRSSRDATQAPGRPPIMTWPFGSSHHCPSQPLYLWWCPCIRVEKARQASEQSSGSQDYGEGLTQAVGMLAEKLERVDRRLDAMDKRFDRLAIGQDQSLVVTPKKAAKPPRKPNLKETSLASTVASEPESMQVVDASPGKRDVDGVEGPSACKSKPYVFDQGARTSKPVDSQVQTQNASTAPAPPQPELPPAAPSIAAPRSDHLPGVPAALPSPPEDLS
mmetsp:Transcript_77856/g.166958  ORF Transcript_77856/g.166958 Transcript_77856/m.166958 type:complete len:959 (+) Transcript_77856:77-2953(+)